jgi:hypothetical protein
MTWFKVDDNLAFHRKVVAAGNAAMGLWVRAGSWSAQHLTDGFVPEHMVGLLGTSSQARRLIKAGLWAEVAGGCQFHQWNEKGRQPTSQSVLADREKSAARQAKWRAAKSEDPQVSDAGDGVTDALVTPFVTGGVTPAPTRPDPNTPPNGGVAAPPRRRGTRIPEDFTVTVDMVAWARDHVPAVDGRRETEKFIDFWRAKPGAAGVKADWVSTWRNWMRKADEDLETRRPTHLRAVAGGRFPAPGYDENGNPLRDPKTGVWMER